MNDLQLSTYRFSVAPVGYFKLKKASKCGDGTVRVRFKHTHVRKLTVTSYIPDELTPVEVKLYTHELWRHLNIGCQDWQEDIDNFSRKLEEVLNAP